MLQRYARPPPPNSLRAVSGETPRSLSCIDVQGVDSAVAAGHEQAPSGLPEREVAAAPSTELPSLLARVQVEGHEGPLPLGKDDGPGAMATADEQARRMARSRR